MISVTRKKQVLNYHIVYGYGAKKIISVLEKEGRMPMSRNTIRKYINKYEDILSSKGQEAALAYANSKEEYQTPERKRTKLDKTACEYIEYWLKENKRRRIAGEQKQCIDMQEVWRLLVEEKGYSLSYSTITAYAREFIAKEEAQKTPHSKECFIRQYHPAGEECQFDWGDVKLEIHGRKMTVRMAAFVLPHSNYRRGYLFIREHTLAFKESHRNFYRDTDRIPLRMVYDNMKVAVKSFVGDKTPTDALIEMSNFYGFQFRFCNARKGNEKGNVEESVKVLRKAAFSVRTKFDTLEEAQEYLDMVCARLNNSTEEIVRLTEEDFGAMRTKKDDLACFQLSDRKVNKYSVIDVENAHYSVPDRFAQSLISIRNYTNKIEVLDGGKVVAMHEKVADGEWCVTLDHYLTTLAYKPGALKNAVALRQAPAALQKLFHENFQNEPKSFIDLLLFAKEKGKTYDEVIDAYESLKDKKVKVINLQLMESTLVAETEPEKVLWAETLQNGAEIEQQAEAGLAKATAIMMNFNTNTSNYAASR